MIRECGFLTRQTIDMILFAYIISGCADHGRNGHDFDDSRGRICTRQRTHHGRASVRTGQGSGQARREATVHGDAHGRAYRVDSDRAHVVHDLHAQVQAVRVGALAHR
jgi:hypothetical protein